MVASRVRREATIFEKLPPSYGAGFSSAPHICRCSPLRRRPNLDLVSMRLETAGVSVEPIRMDPYTDKRFTFSATRMDCRSNYAKLNNECYPFGPRRQRWERHFYRQRQGCYRHEMANASGFAAG